eukprot:2028477-Prymnesium_polylepis.2
MSETACSTVTVSACARPSPFQPPELSSAAVRWQAPWQSSVRVPMLRAPRRDVHVSGSRASRSAGQLPLKRPHLRRLRPRAQRGRRPASEGCLHWALRWRVHHRSSFRQRWRYSIKSRPV